MRRRNETTDSLDARLPEDLLRLVSPRVVISIRGVVSSFRLGCCTGGGDNDGYYRGGGDDDGYYRGGDDDGYRSWHDGYRGGQDSNRGGEDSYRPRDSYRGLRDSYRGGEDSYRPRDSDGFRHGDVWYGGGNPDIQPRKRTRTAPRYNAIVVCLPGLEEVVIEELQALGISAVKIEGRQRSPAYISSVARTWRQAIDRLASGRQPAVDPQWHKTLSGLSEGSQVTLGPYQRAWQ